MRDVISIVAKSILVLVTTSVLSAAQWSYQSSPLWPYVDLGKVQFVSDQEGWISAGNGSLLHTTDGGGTWDVVTPFQGDTVFVLCDPSISMWWADAKHGWLVGSAGTGFQNAHGGVVYRTTDGGVTWSKKASGNAGEIGVQVQFVNDSVGWVSGFNLLTQQPEFFKTTNGGSSWNSSGVTQLPSGGIFYFVDVNNGWGVNNSGIAPPPYGIIKTTDGGSTWTKVYADTTPHGFNALQFLDVNNGWVIGRDNAVQILKTRDGGLHWTKVGVPPLVTETTSLFFLNPDTGWVAVRLSSSPTDLPAIIFTADGGANWSIESISSPGGAGKIFSIYFRDFKNGWFTQEQCTAHCDGPDTLKVFAGLISHTTNNGGVTKIAQHQALLKSFQLDQNYPNPFNPSTIISFELPIRSHVMLTLYDVLGRQVKTLIDENREAGHYSVALDASGLSSGVYFYRFMARSLGVESQTYIESKKLVVVK